MQRGADGSPVVASMEDFMRAVLSAAAGLVATLGAWSAPAAAAPPAEKPSVHVGDVVEYDARYVSVPCKRWEVKDTDKAGSVIMQCDDKLAYFSVATGNLTKIASLDGEAVVEFKPFSPSISFPLEVGKKWQGKYTGYTADNGYRWAGDSSCEVKSAETVKVPAGDFEAYRIDCVDSWKLGGATGQAHSSAWYAPKAATVIKYIQTEDPKWNYEVTSITRK
jgi:hypothetical protein